MARRKKTAIGGGIIIPDGPWGGPTLVRNWGSGYQLPPPQNRAARRKSQRRGRAAQRPEEATP